GGALGGLGERFHRERPIRGPRPENLDAKRLSIGHDCGIVLACQESRPIPALASKEVSNLSGSKSIRRQILNQGKVCHRRVSSQIVFCTLPCNSSPAKNSAV